MLWFSVWNSLICPMGAVKLRMGMVSRVLVVCSGVREASLGDATGHCSLTALCCVWLLWDQNGSAEDLHQAFV